MNPMVIRERHRWLYLVLAWFALALSAMFAWVLFSPEPEIEVGFGGTVAFTFFAGVGVFLAVAWTRRFFANPPMMVLTEEGFRYTPAGFDTGLIRWDDVADVRVEQVIASRGRRMGTLPAIAVELRDPDAYIARHPAILQGLFKFREGETGTPLLIRPEDLQGAHDQVIAAMRERIARRSRS